MKTLETERLILRGWEISDKEDLYEYAQNESVGPFAGWKPHKNILESEDIIRMFLSSDDVYAIEHKDTKKVIGSLGIHRRNPDGLEQVEQREIGYVLNPLFWGNGYIPEAVFRVLKYCFEEMNYDVVWCGHFDFNDKSKRVNEKCGFIYQFTTEGKAQLLDNMSVRTLYYCMTKEEYLDKINF